jgi:carbonic anhydrase
MQNLVRGIHQFQTSYFASNRALFERLAAAGQRPETLFITCSDSRVIPEMITSAAPGELFIVRNVGNIVPRDGEAYRGGAVAALEYAVEVLDVSTVIVCGHTGCGAMQAVLDPTSVAGLPHVRHWLEQTTHVRDVVQSRYADLDGEARLTAAVEENVLFQLESLRAYPFVANRLADGRLAMAGWVFKIATGEVFDYDPVAESFTRLVGPR